VWDDVTPTTARLVYLVSADEHNGILVAGWFTIDQTLGMTGRPPTDHTDGLEFVDALRKRQQRRHRTKGLAAKVHIQAGADHALPLISQGIAGCGDAFIKELHFVDGNDVSIRFYQRGELFTVSDGDSLGPKTVVGSNRGLTVPSINAVLEDLNLLSGNLGAAKTTEQLLSFAAEHAATDDFNPTTAGLTIHR
jgi:hypothetical protein